MKKRSQFKIRKIRINSKLEYISVFELNFRIDHQQKVKIFQSFLLASKLKQHRHNSCKS